jgi:chaperonin GroEL
MRPDSILEYMNVSKGLLFGNEAHEKILKGVEAVAKLVGSTLGPKGRCVIVERIATNLQTKEVIRMGPMTTKDGVSVARAIALPDPVENLGCDLIREAASRTVAEAGDGTTASVVLAHKLIKDGFELVKNGLSPVWLRAGIDKAVTKVLELLTQMSLPCNEERESQIANIAANGDPEIGQVVTEAIKKAGPNGIVSVDNARSGKTHIEYSDGMRFDSGLRYQGFITDFSRNECILENPFLLLHERRIQSIPQIEKLLQAVASTGRPLLIISEEFELPIISFLLTNLTILKSCVVVAPFYGERRRDFLRDLAVFTGGTAITEELGIDLKMAGIDILGQAEKIIVTKAHTTIIGGQSKGNELEERVMSLQNALKITTNGYEKEIFAERLAKLDGGVAVIKIGAYTDTEAKEKRDRTEDACLSVKCAQEAGIIPGGGIALLRCSENIELLNYILEFNKEEQAGAKLILNAMEAPLRQILKNGGYLEDEIMLSLQRKENPNIGFDALTGQVVDMLNSGIIDPTKVIKQALMNAASLAGTLLTTSGTIVHLEQK